MPTKEELILENELLHKKLALAERWIHREIASHKQKIREKWVKDFQRKNLENILERESVDIITRKMVSYFGDSLRKSPKHTLEHLIDAEIYWQTLQKFPTLDALPVVSSYQKILDAFFRRVSSGFCEYIRCNQKNIWQNIYHIPRKETHGFERDIENILEKKYTLSLGRWYQIFSWVREDRKFRDIYASLFHEYLSHHHARLLEVCITDPVFSWLGDLITIEVFGRKRHDTKISYTDAKKTRNILLPQQKKNSPLLSLLAI